MVHIGKCTVRVVKTDRPTPLTEDDVLGWFADAANLGSGDNDGERKRRLGTPTKEDAIAIAERIAIARSLGPAPPLLWLSDETRKYARLFLSHFESDIASMKDRGAGASRAIGHLEGYLEAVKGALTAVAAPPPNLATTKERVTLELAALAGAAWERVGKRPRSLAPDDPLVAFVKAALKAAGYNETGAAISYTLRAARKRA
ncbi:MAG: hypothetical protein ABSE69_09195 [Roseiarcus sp.]